MIGRAGARALPRAGALAPARVNALALARVNALALACVGALALACTMLLLAPAVAGASNVSDAQLRSLAVQAAGGDRAALEQLRRVDAVDGVPANLAAALATQNRIDLESRLRALTASAAGASVPDARQAQATAAAVLRQRGYGRAPLPDPIGTVFSKIGRFLSKLASKTPGGPVVFWLILAAVVVVAAALGARRMTRRLDAAARTAPTADTGDALDPCSLERRADAAEAHGAYDEAIRLRFQAGLLALGERGRIAYRPSLLTGEARRELHSETFDELAGSFEQVAYGHATADAEQATATRARWLELLETSESAR